jgi:hypothetical protein
MATVNSNLLRQPPPLDWPPSVYRPQQQETNGGCHCHPEMRNDSAGNHQKKKQERINRLMDNLPPSWKKQKPSRLVACMRARVWA